jgi:PAS domain S-box-containing protein
MKILLVEDDTKFCQLLKNVIETMENSDELDVEEFYTAEAALQAYQKEFYPIIVTDIDLPEMDGMEFCRNIREMPEGDDSIIIVETGVIEPKELNKVLQAGADDYIFKPLDMTLFEIRLQIAIKNSKERLMRKSVQKELQESEEKFRALAENSLDVIMRFDKNLRHLYVNPPIEAQTGIPPEEFIGKTHEELGFPDELVAIWDEAINEIFATGASQRVEFQLPTGVWIDWLLVPEFDSNGDVRAVITFARDITDRKSAEEALKQSEHKLKELNAAKDKFFSIIAHDIKNPLGTMVGFSDLLINHYDNLNQEQRMESIKGINESSNRLFKLLENLLEWSRSQTGRIDFNPEEIDLSYIVNSCIILLRESAAAKNINLFSEIKQGTQVFVDVDMITAVVRNLISNAIKFTPIDGDIKIITMENDDALTICVSDTGIGICDEDLDKLFRIDISHTTPGTASERGTGLGLILCKEFVERHGGNIWVESQEGEGSTFKFTLPKNAQVMEC